MPHVTLRTTLNASDKDDLIVEVKENTYDYLRTATVPTMRVSAYLDRDWPTVREMYAEIYLDETCTFESKITRVTPGSRARMKVALPGPMMMGEQLTLEVQRRNRFE